ncbi:MAG: hypothetical protein NXI20_20265 [bacterium]|nr:hypothetical protein [bacterium]
MKHLIRLFILSAVATVLFAFEGPAVTLINEEPKLNIVLTSIEEISINAEEELVDQFFKNESSNAKNRRGSETNFTYYLIMLFATLVIAQLVLRYQMKRKNIKSSV